MANEETKVRRIVDLDVKEVSLVDRPAIRRTFLVIKRLEEEPMGAFATEDRVIQKSAETEDEEKKKAGKGKDEMGCKAGPDEEDEEKKKAGTPEEDPNAMKADPEEEEKQKAGMPPKALAAMIRGIKGAPKAAVDELVGYLETKSKAAPAGDEYPSPKTKNLVVVKSDGSIEINAEVTKGRKMFTEQRANMLKDTIISLARVLHEADEEATKAVVAELKALPSNSTVASSVRPANAGKQKAGDEDDADVEKLKSEVSSLTKRLSDIENTRQVSKSATNDSTDNKKPVQKSLWSGLL